MIMLTEPGKGQFINVQTRVHGHSSRIVLVLPFRQMVIVWVAILNINRRLVILTVRGVWHASLLEQVIRNIV